MTTGETDLLPGSCGEARVRQEATSTRQHGTKAKYVVDKCRCDECKRGARDYERWRCRQRAYGKAAYIDAGPARAHVQALQDAGMGWKRVARAAGLSESVVWKLLYGDRTRNLAPSKRIRPRTATLIFAVTADLADGARVDATGTHRRLQALIANGWSGSSLGRRLGMTPANFWTMLRRRYVTAGKARQVRGLYDELWRAQPPTGTVAERGAVTRAQGFAQDYGWLPPLWWDDETIDDPTAAPYRPCEPAPAAGPGRPRLTLAGDVDEIAVERLARGEIVTGSTTAERYEAFVLLRARGVTASAAAELLRLSPSARSLFIQTFGAVA